MKAVQKNPEIIVVERVAKLILLIRGQRVILDEDIARLYGVTTGNLNKAVARNKERFPEDFCFQLTIDEIHDVESQHISFSSKGGRRYLPFVFTEEGVAMLSSVLRSKRAAEVNVAIMRAFIQMRHAVQEQEAFKKVMDRILAIEKKTEGHAEQLKEIFETLKQLTTIRKPAIGFRLRLPDKKEK